MYSQDGSARNGGELGLSGRNQWVKPFADVAFSLNDPKKVSKIVKTEFGYHIIQLIEKRGDKVNARHILLKPEIKSEEVERLPLALRLYRHGHPRPKSSHSRMLLANFLTTRYEKQPRSYGANESHAT